MQRLATNPQLPVPNKSGWDIVSHAPHSSCCLSVRFKSCSLTAARHDGDSKLENKRMLGSQKHLMFIMFCTVTVWHIYFLISFIDVHLLGVFWPHRSISGRTNTFLSFVSLNFHCDMSFRTGLCYSSLRLCCTH